MTIIEHDQCRDAADYPLPDGTVVAVRPICREDAARLRRMFERLSPTTIYLRFFSPVVHPPESMFRHLATVDHDRREALVALEGDEIVGVARYDGTSQPGEAEIAVTVEDSWQHRGVGTLLLGLLTREARGHGIDAFYASMLPDNRVALSMLHRLAPDARANLSSGTYEATIKLQRSSSEPRPVDEPVHEP